LIYAPRALADLNNAIRRWQTQSGAGQAAKRRLKAIRATFLRLRHHPCLFPVGDNPGVRELPCDGGYRALYRVDPDTGTATPPGT